MRPPRLLDLFCGAGGAAAGYAQAGYEIVGVDSQPQPRYPFDLICADALEVLDDTDFLRSFDLIHASPPCQAFTAYRRKGKGVGSRSPDLIPRTRKGLQRSRICYVIENVPGAPLHMPVQLCGSSFNLNVRRHRLFETNWVLRVPCCDHSWQTPRFPPASNRKNLRSTVEVGVARIPLSVQKIAMGIDWMTRRELSQAIPPAYTRYIGMCYRSLLHV